MCGTTLDPNHGDRDQIMKHSRDRDRNKNAQLFNIQNSITFDKFTVIANGVMFLHKPRDFSR